MGAILSRIKLAHEIDGDSLAAELSARTGVGWNASLRTLSGDTVEIVLEVPGLGWQVLLTRDRALGAYLVETVPNHWLSINYQFWQVIASLVKLGGSYISRDGKELPMTIPKWTSKKWSELSWWARYGR